MAHELDAGSSPPEDQDLVFEPPAYDGHSRRLEERVFHLRQYQLFCYARPYPHFARHRESKRQKGAAGRDKGRVEPAKRGHSPIHSQEQQQQMITHAPRAVSSTFSFRRGELRGCRPGRVDGSTRSGLRVLCVTEESKMVSSPAVRFYRSRGRAAKKKKIPWGYKNQ